MRRVVYAASFVDDADGITTYIEDRFGVSHAETFIEGLNSFCERIASVPGIGKQNHGYDTTLYGVVYETNWIFFQLDAEEVRFVHIIDSRRHKAAIAF
jgi:plasmid stabilization system protein ParE